ncbi:PTS system fructose-specific IIB component/fructose-specific PTS system IIB-like component [Gibbsiella quercinecans]|uniref:PTS sugar transporter subunit IIC n=1 Tax=Gibbsiella quercinecans TaxID=929813 RepID=A0A250AWF7_9GAMM|nr:fructose PTS transporter subunit IIB [Gibbsiella quercinecans]ATA18195.1 PTS sugar transporter subunit IIC [Gibbsiella quercinecans]RLM06764.1 PTS sugar transporter subunit IIC [Gibbsiella quercinecans]RLM12920.1 PTS sugar transporter subunit IIC [Gibbsiella quercinecans]TCT92535.1 PTS system fructose-specific IIB component/fructose-specific PTS system IIB-like component [Gibbsiella quercinecans]
MYIVCVTSCAVGIAHTYMAAANLKKTAENIGLEIKIETQGAQGTENEITNDDIIRADACIIASDVRIRNGDRFDALPTLTVSASEAVRHPESIIKELMEALE